MKIHELKILQEYNSLREHGFKSWELRKNDRDFKSGDIVFFTVINTKGEAIKKILTPYKITYIFHGGKYGLEKGYCILTLKHQ